MDVDRYYRRVAPFLDRELARRGDRDFWRRLAERLRPRSVLEIGCGTGRVTELLSRTASRVVGIDISRDLLRRAHRRLAGRPGVRLLHADVRDLALDRRFDLVVAPDDPFVHLLSDPGRQAALRAVARHLEPGGRFVLDGLWWTPVERRRARSEEGLRTERTVDAARAAPGTPRQAAANGRGTRPDPDAATLPPLRIRESWHLDAEGPGFRARYRYERPGRPPVEAGFRGRRWTGGELGRRLRRLPLRILRRCGGYDGRRWVPATADVLLAEVERTPSPTPSPRPEASRP